jgi:hypothetical protein
MAASIDLAHTSGSFFAGELSLVFLIDERFAFNSTFESKAARHSQFLLNTDLIAGECLATSQPLADSCSIDSAHEKRMMCGSPE